MENSCKTSRNTENKVLSTHSGNMEDDMKRLSDLEDDIEQLRRATLQIQDCFEKLIRIWELGSPGRAVTHMRLKNDFKKLELITSEFENKT